jgi:hypothetical protein
MIIFDKNFYEALFILEVGPTSNFFKISMSLPQHVLEFEPTILAVVAILLTINAG